jgi:hypothetical protein
VACAIAGGHVTRRHVVVCAIAGGHVTRSHESTSHHHHPHPHHPARYCALSTEHRRATLTPGVRHHETQSNAMHCTSMHLSQERCRDDAQDSIGTRHRTTSWRPNGAHWSLADSHSPQTSTSDPCLVSATSCFAAYRRLRAAQSGCSFPLLTAAQNRCLPRT